MEDIIQSVRDGNTLAVRSWIDSIENDYNQSDDHGFSLLHWSCWNGRYDIAEMLLDKGAKLDALNRCEDTPLHCAVQNNHLDLALLLIKNKANLSSFNLHGNTPLHYACHFGYTELAIELIKLGASINVCNVFNQTPLDLCNKIMKQELTNVANSLRIDTSIRIPFKQNQEQRRLSKKKSDFSIFNQLNVNIDELPVERMIESNHGGTTWKGYWQGAEVAIKVLKVKEANQKLVNQFNEEYKRLRVFNSPYVLPIVGACASLPDLIIVNPFMPYGSLFNVLHEKSEILIDAKQANKIAIQIAKGVEYLHQNLESILPKLQLNSKHIMVDEELNAKINLADFQFSFTNSDKIHNPAWMAPELLKKRVLDINKKSADMWSFAVIIWELHKRQIPFANYSPAQCGFYIAEKNLRLELDSELSPQIQKLIKICMNEEPNKRPKFEMIIPILEKFKFEK